MQKKLIALAIASAMTVPALAYAEASISGQANMSIDNLNDGATTASASAWQLNSNQSRLIIKGSEDLGDGMSAMFQLDSRFNLDTGTIGTTAATNTAKLFDGNTYVGVKSNFGTVMMGRIDSPYKTSTRSLDVFFDVAGDNRAGVGAIGGLFTHENRFSNTIAYVSPAMSGFGIAAAAIFGGETPVANSTKGTGYSLNGTWKMDAFYAALAYESLKYGTNGTGDLGAAATCSTTTICFDDTNSTFKLAGGWSADAFTLNAIIEMPSYKVGSGAESGAETTNTNFYLGGKFAFSATDAVKLAYTDKGDQEVKGGTTPGKLSNHTTQIAVGYDHSMSKATSVYANYVKTSANNAAGTAADPSVLSLGMKHAF